MNPTADALGFILHRRVWDYGRDFNTLWRMELCGQNDVVIVWADTPADPNVSPVDTEPFITPFDWAIAACALNEKLCVTVVDLRPIDHQRLEERKDREGNVFKEARYAALRWLETQNPGCVPWLRRFKSHDLITTSGIDELRKWVSRGAEKKAPDVQTTPRDALRTLPVCRVDLSGEDNHHSIANLIGPLLLIRKDIPNAGARTPDHRLALRKIFEAAGFIPPQSANGAGGEPITSSPLLPENADPVHFVLVDDQWHHGWAQWLAERLALEWTKERATAARPQDREGPQCVAGDPGRGVSLWVSSDPNWLLRCAIKAKGAEKDARFKLRLTDDSEAPEILLLDLRLFPAARDEDGKNFAKKVAEAAQPFVGAGAWAESLDHIELAAVKEEKKGHEIDAASLTLLPRFLSQTDFTLPIVLFSSTGRRDIMGKLRGYGNIFPQFAKPRLLGEAGQDIRERSEDTLDDAINAALHWAAARKLCMNIMGAASAYRPAARTANAKFQHFELYIDESGKGSKKGDAGVTNKAWKLDNGKEDKRFVVGGLLVGYSDLDGFRILHDEMERDGLCWRHSDTKPFIRKKCGTDERREILAKFLQHSSGRPIYGVCLEHLEDMPSSKLVDPKHSDNRYRRSLSTMLEMILFELLPAVAAPNATISIYVATRSRSQKDFKYNLHSYQDLYGYHIGWDTEGEYLQSFANDSALPVLLEILARREEVSANTLASRVNAVRGVGLAYGNQKLHWLPTRHQHYMADVVANLAYHDGANFTDASGYSEVFQSGIYDFSGVRLNSMLRASRELSFDNYTAAILELANFAFYMKIDQRSAMALILKRLDEVIRQRLTGQNFAILAQTVEPEEQFRSRAATMTEPVIHATKEEKPVESMSPVAELATPVATPDPPLRRGRMGRILSGQFVFILSDPPEMEVRCGIGAWRGKGEWPPRGARVKFSQPIKIKKGVWTTQEVWPEESAS